jgi:outer membrane protein OmpA-like peptidoglycan-associated protein
MVPDISGTFDFSLAENYGVSGGLIKPYPGFHAGAGYQWRNIRLSLETGYTRIKGDNPLVLDIGIVPLTFKGGYVFSFLRDRLTITPLLGAGLVFAGAEHYETVIDMLFDRTSYSTGRGFFANATLRLGWSFAPALTLYAGAGIDCLIETGGPIPLPALELGLTLKPFSFRNKSPAAGSLVPEPLKTGPAVFVEDPEDPRPIFSTIYFPADEAVPAQAAELDRTGELLRARPELRISLRGYTAPYSTPAARRALSEERVRFCAAYLIREYGIAEERISVEWYGADQLPDPGDDSDQRRRCVEILIEPVQRP